MLSPAYKLVIGNATVDTTDDPQTSTLTHLSIALDMDTPADTAVLTLGNDQCIMPETGDETRIELGFAEDDPSLTLVFTGAVVRVDRSLKTTRAVAHSAAYTLLRRFTDKTFEDHQAGKIVRDLAGQASVQVDRVENGIQFPAYVVDGRLSFYHHMRNLARFCGFDLYLNRENKLVFREFVGGNNIHNLEYAKHPLSLDIKYQPATFSKVEAWGESPGGGKAKEAWAWLTKDFSGLAGESGSGAPVQLLEAPALRHAEAAKSAAEAAQTRNQRFTVRGNLCLTGQPGIKLGDAVRLQDLPDEKGNGNYQVRRINHRLDKRHGFTTVVAFQSIDPESRPGPAAALSQNAGGIAL